MGFCIWHQGKKKEKEKKKGETTTWCPSNHTYGSPPNITKLVGYMDDGPAWVLRRWKIQSEPGAYVKDLSEMSNLVASRRCFGGQSVHFQKSCVMCTISTRGIHSSVPAAMAWASVYMCTRTCLKYYFSGGWVGNYG
jgi:hypothetical protein